jgi:hypothetical protein
MENQSLLVYLVGPQSVFYSYDITMTWLYLLQGIPAPMSLYHTVNLHVAFNYRDIQFSQIYSILCKISMIIETGPRPFYIFIFYFNIPSAPFFFVENLLSKSCGR